MASNLARSLSPMLGAFSSLFARMEASFSRRTHQADRKVRPVADGRKKLLVTIVGDVGYADLAPVAVPFLLADIGGKLGEELAGVLPPHRQPVELGRVDPCWNGIDLQLAGGAIFVWFGDFAISARCMNADLAIAEAPSMLWLLRVKQTTSTSGIWTVHMPDVSLTPVLLSIGT